MPGLIMERPKMSLQMHETLKKYILSERKKKKEEDVANEQKRKEQLKKAEMNTLTFEQTKSQLNQLESKLEELAQKKRDLFYQLKKVLNEETTLKKRPLQNANETFLLQHNQALVYPSQLKFYPQTNRLSMFKTEIPVNNQVLKRQRSPSPSQQLIATSPNIYQSNIIGNTGMANSSNINYSQNPNVFSPNKKTRTTNPANFFPTTPLNTFSPIILNSPKSRPNATYNQQPPQSTFTSYPNNFITAVAMQQQQQQQKSNSTPASISSSSSPTNIPYVVPRFNPIDPNQQKLLFQPQQLLISHPQNGSILTGFPLQRPPQQPF